MKKVKVEQFNTVLVEGGPGSGRRPGFGKKDDNMPNLKGVKWVRGRLYKDKTKAKKGKWAGAITPAGKGIKTPPRSK